MAILDRIQPRDALDVGCGDGQAMVGLGPSAYVGLDLSPEALGIAEVGRPDGDFRLGSIVDHDVRADLTICLDVLIHQSDRSVYRELVGRLLASSRQALLISGYEMAPPSSPMIHFHEPLSETLDSAAPDIRLEPVREVHGITTFLVRRPT